MIKQTLLLSLVGITLTGCVVAPFDDGPYYSSSPSYGHGYNRPHWNNNNGHRPPPKPIKPQHPNWKPPQSKPPQHGQKPPPNYRPPQQVKPNFKQPRIEMDKGRPTPNVHRSKPQKMTPLNAPRMPNSQRPLRP
jgi:hypothetical protein